MRPQYFLQEELRASQPSVLRTKWKPNLRLFGALIILFLASCNAFAQVQQTWIARYNNGINNGINQALRMALDSQGNIYVNGVSQNTNNQLGYVTIKYAPNGNQLWAARYDSTNYPTASPSAFALDNSNNVIVTGSALTVKYDTNGNQLWTAPYPGSTLAVDTNGNVVIAGFGTSFNAVKLSPSGTNLWQKTFPATCGAAVGQAIAADPSGDIYVAGSYPFACQEGLIDYELLIIKYNASGNQVWTSTYQAAGGLPQVDGAALDYSGNLDLLVDFSPIVPGSRFNLFNYTPSGTLNWTAYPIGQWFVRQGHGLAIGVSNSVVATGQLTMSFTLQVDLTAAFSSNGEGLWTNLCPSDPNAVGTNASMAVAVDSANNAYTTGFSPGTHSWNNIVTSKYGPNGNRLWLQSYNGLNAGNDAGNAIAVDRNGNVYVTGYETLHGGGTGIVTIKYIPISIQRQTNGTVLIETQGSPGESFDIQASSDLLNWLDLGSVLADTNGLMQFDDTNAPNFPARFYYANPR